MTKKARSILMELHLGKTWGKDLVDPSVLRGPSAHSEHNGQGNSLGVQWLGPSTVTAGAMGLIPGWGAKSLQAVCAAKKQKPKKNPMARASGSPETLTSLNSRPLPPPAKLPTLLPSFPPAITFDFLALEDLLHDQLPLQEVRPDHPFAQCPRHSV